MQWTSEDVFEAIEAITLASGYGKRLFLHEKMKPYLKAAYDPFTRYHQRRNENELPPGGNCIFGLTTWELLDKLASRALSGIEAQMAVDQHLAILRPDSGRLLCRILNKDLRMGMGAKSINKVFPKLIPEHKIMLAKKIDWNRIKYPCWASVKKDGVRGTFYPEEFYSRRGLAFVGLDHIIEELSDIDYKLDGELTVPGETFQVGSGMIRSNNPTPRACFSIFELPDYDRPFRERILAMDDFRNYSPHVTSLKQWLIPGKKALLQMYKLARQQGHEGLIVRPYDYKYVGSRSYSWMKLKPLMEDLELKCVRVYEGTGKYIGMLGGATVEYHNSKGMKLVDVGSGFTDAQRQEYWMWPGESPLIGAILQCEAMEETDDGSLRHPIFKEVKE